MTPAESIGIALIGMGSAGRSREKACTEAAGIQLTGRVSRRAGCGDRSWEEVLRDPGVEAVAVSTENTSHADLVQAGLEAGKHVLCDYPLALSGSRARELFNLARQKGRVLHVEHIALLSEEHQNLKSEVAVAGNLMKGEYLFQGGWNEKLADTASSGPHPFLSVSRLLQVADLFGPFQIETARIDLKTGGFSMHLHLKFLQGGILGFTEERLIGLPRRRSLIASCKLRPVTLKAGTLGGGLFAKDLEWFRDRVTQGKPCYYNEETMLSILDLLANLPAAG